MNLTSIGRIPSKSNWKRTIKGQYVAAAAGVALVIGAVVVGGSLERGSGSVARADLSVPVQRQVSQADIDAALLSTEMATYDFTAQPVEQRQVSQADIAASVLSTELAAYGVPVAPAQPADVEHYGMGQTPLLVAPPAAEADIAASVLSTELAAYGAPVVQRVVSDADIAASVLSTELANFAQ